VIGLYWEHPADLMQSRTRSIQFVICFISGYALRGAAARGAAAATAALGSRKVAADLISGGTS